MERISRHISYIEAVRSEVASRKGIDNTPNSQQLINMRVLAEKVIEPAREYISTIRGIDTPLHISSYLRRPLVNKEVGGSKTSQHEAGEETGKKESAVDLEAHYSDFTNKDLFLVFKERGGFDQLIAEFKVLDQPAWVHVSFRDIADGGNRGEILIAEHVDGTTLYHQFSPETWSRIYG